MNKEEADGVFPDLAKLYPGLWMEQSFEAEIGWVIHVVVKGKAKVLATIEEAKGCLV